MPTSPLDFVIRPLPDRWKPILPRFRRCTPRLLIVTDGLSFDNAGFGLGVFLAELAKDAPAPAVTTKVRDPGVWTFDASVNVDNFDQLWLFGVGGTPLSDDEVHIIARFMEAGGGVFATGDHESLGANLCGELPRVRKMRDWHTTPMEVERIDTVTNPGRDRRTQFDDQSDAVPQRIYPTYYGSGDTWTVHPLLRSPLGDIDVLPDHAHESVCLVGHDLGERYTLHGLDLDEFPAVAGSPLAPEIVAHAVSAGRYLNPPGSTFGKPPTTPRLFGAISAWDGHRVGRGRIVCDATWHHFININLDGTEAVAAPGNDRNGLRDAATGQFTEDFHQIAQYYRNIVDWLTPSGRRWCRWWIDLVIERYRFPLFEELRPLPPHPCPWEPRVALGANVDVAIERAFGPGFTEQLVTAALEDADLQFLADYVRPLAGADRAAEGIRPLLDHVELRRGILGSLADALLGDLPDSPERLADELPAEHDDGELRQRVVDATRSAWEAARVSFAGRLETTSRFLK